MGFFFIDINTTGRKEGVETILNGFLFLHQGITQKHGFINKFLVGLGLQTSVMDEVSDIMVENNFFNKALWAFHHKDGI